MREWMSEKLDTRADKALRLTLFPPSSRSTALFVPRVQLYPHTCLVSVTLCRPCSSMSCIPMPTRVSVSIFGNSVPKPTNQAAGRTTLPTILVHDVQNGWFYRNDSTIDQVGMSVCMRVCLHMHLGQWGILLWGLLVHLSNALQCPLPYANRRQLGPNRRQLEPNRFHLDLTHVSWTPTNIV